MPEALSRPQRSVAHVLDDWDARGGMTGSATALVTAEGIARVAYRGMANVEQSRPVVANTDHVAPWLAETRAAFAAARSASSTSSGGELTF